MVAYAVYLHMCSKPSIFSNHQCVKSMHETLIYVFVHHGNELSGGRDTTKTQQQQH